MKKPRLPKKDKEPEKPKKCCVPVGPRFQADIPAWTGLPDRASYIHNTELLCLANEVWGAINFPQNTGERIGAGRPDNCECNRPGSIECVRIHVSEKRGKLRSELRSVFVLWKFHKMGEQFSKTLTEAERAKFKHCHIIPEGGKLSTEGILRQSMISHYFNVYIPERMRSSNYKVDTDDEGGEEEEEASPSDKESSEERPREKEPVKTKYLSGLR